MKIVENLELKEYNSYRICAIAKTVFFPETLDDIIGVVDLPGIVIIGGGCNIILSKGYYEKENFVFIRENFSGIQKLRDDRLKVKSGTDLKDLSLFAYENSLSGLEYFYDIPGCVGGATIMNAGCNGVSFGDFIESVTYYDINNKKIYTVSSDDLSFRYRGSQLSSMNIIILEVELSLRIGERGSIWNVMQENKEKRWQKQPRDYPSAGSVFKRPAGHYVGPMITEVGLKGYRIGDAMFSDKHAGFIVNVGNAKGRDVLSLVATAQEKVKKLYDVNLELEQRVI